jgi:hypothetical protein
MNNTKTKTAVSSPRKSTQILKSSRLLPQKYTVQNREQKKQQCFKNMQFNFAKSARKMTLGLHLTENQDTVEKMIKEELLHALEACKIQTIVIGENPHSFLFKHIKFVKPNQLKDIEKTVDAYIWPNEDRELFIMHHGTVCISKSHRHISHYSAQEEKGDGIFCKSNTHWQLFAALIRLEETYKFVYDWKHLCQNAMDRSYAG